MTYSLRFSRVLFVFVALLLSAVGAPAEEAGSVPAGETVEMTELSWDLLEDLSIPLNKWKNDIEHETNDDGARYKSAVYSKTPRKIDDTTYLFTAHVNTATRDHQLTERVELTVKREGSGQESWEVVDQKVVDTYVGLYRSTGMACMPFEKFQLSREGMTVSASNGSVCEAYFQGKVSMFVLQADVLSHSYQPPDHAALVSTGHDYYAMHALARKTHAEQLDIEPAAVMVRCDPDTCEEIIEESFTGLTRTTPEEREKFDYDRSAIDDWIRPYVNDVLQARKDDAFSGFRLLDEPGNRWYSIGLVTELKDRDDGIWLNCDNWGVNDGWEVVFYVIPQRFDVPDQLAGPIYGYFTEETLANSTPYELDQRQGGLSRWFEVESVKGRVDLATIDVEKVQGDVEFGLVLRQDTDKLPFGIISFRGAGNSDRPKPISVNSIRVDGQELTWVKTGPLTGIAVLPEEVSAGSKVNLRMHWESKALVKYTSSYSYLPRQGWMPFVRFGDFIDEFELTIRSPAKYDLIGVGHKEEERIEDDVRISRWRADMPVNFPTIILGRYKSDHSGKVTATKLDGTEIPVSIHVDMDSFSSRGIALKSMRPLAQQAANSINLYSAVSGLDYPFGELNLVNDPYGMLYGQAPSSIIYLGFGVFQNEGELAPYFLDPSSISRFLRSVVAHEVGHQWWGNRIANANYRNYWFVESLAEYFSAIYTEYAYGWDAYMQQVDDWRKAIVESTLKSNVQNATTLFAGEWGGGNSGNPRTAAIYNKGPYAFHMLRETFKGEGPRGNTGADARFFAFLEQASKELAAKGEIVTLDIQQAAEKAFGGVDQEGNPYNVDLSWFFDQWIRGSGLPQYRLDWKYRETEDGKYIVEGTIYQRVMLGRTDEVLEGQVYRGVVNLQVEAKGGPYAQRFIINEAETPVLLKLPEKPTAVTLNEDGGMLALDTKYNDWR